MHEVDGKTVCNDCLANYLLGKKEVVQEFCEADPEFYQWWFDSLEKEDKLVFLQKFFHESEAQGELFRDFAIEKLDDYIHYCGVKRIF